MKGKLDEDLKTVAQNSGGKYEPAQASPSESPLKKILSWVNGSQSAITGALNHVSEQKNPNIASYMKLQYGVQRASQRAELFSSIIGSRSAM